MMANCEVDHVHFQVKPLPEDRARCVISPAEASVKCRSIDVDILLSRLNTLLDTSVDKSRDGVERTLKHFIDSDHDVGVAYGYLRRMWYLDGNLWDHFSECRATGELWEKERQDSIKGDFINNPRSINPRRIWDLFAHRVIPFEFSKINMDRMAYYDKMDGHLPLYPGFHKIPRSLRLVNGADLPPFHPSDVPDYYLGVSHSWVRGMHKSAIETDVNARQWPVPLPPGVTPETVRHELLHLVPSGYVWVDVLCLRQATPHDHDREVVRKNEWGIDVPTMGNIYYHCPAVVRYFNGLGKCFSPFGWNGERHWTRRAWTLQERNATENYIDAGSPNGRPFLSVTSEEEAGVSISDHLKNTIIYPNVLPGPYVSLFEVIRVMVQRYSTNPVDKIAGIGMILGCYKLPVYHEDIPLEDAWARFVRSVPSHHMRDFLFGFPHRGESKGCTWRPTWAQLTGFVHESEKRLPFLLSGRWAKVAEDGHLEICTDVIRECRISEPWPASAGSVTFDKSVPEKGIVRTIVRKAESCKGLDAGTYTFVIENLMWAVCKESTTVPGRLEKVVTIEIEAPELEELFTSRMKNVIIY